MVRPIRVPPPPFWRVVVKLAQFMTAIAALGLCAMIVVTCVDVLLRQFGHPLKGTYDIVRVAGAVTIACSLPITTAMKGHVAIEYFFQRLRRRWRMVVDSIMRIVMIVGCLVAAYQSVGYGWRFFKSNQVTDTIGMPIFWVPWLMAVSFGITALVVVFHLIYPRRELVRS